MLGQIINKPVELFSSAGQNLNAGRFTTRSRSNVPPRRSNICGCNGGYSRIDTRNGDYAGGPPAPYPIGIVGLFKGVGQNVRSSLVVLTVVWFTISYGTYGISTWNNALFAHLGLSNPYACSFIFALCSSLGNLASIVLVEKVCA